MHTYIINTKRLDHKPVTGNVGPKAAPLRARIRSPKARPQHSELSLPSSRRQRHHQPPCDAVCARHFDGDGSSLFLVLVGLVATRPLFFFIFILVVSSSSPWPFLSTTIIGCQRCILTVLRFAVFAAGAIWRWRSLCSNVFFGSRTISLFGTPPSMPVVPAFTALATFFTFSTTAMPVPSFLLLRL